MDHKLNHKHRAEAHGVLEVATAAEEDRAKATGEEEEVTVARTGERTTVISLQRRSNKPWVASSI